MMWWLCIKERNKDKTHLQYCTWNFFFKKPPLYMTLLSIWIKDLKPVQCANHHVWQCTSYWKLHFLPLNEKSQHGYFEYGSENCSSNQILLSIYPGKCHFWNIPITRNYKTWLRAIVESKLLENASINVCLNNYWTEIAIWVGVSF